MISSKPRLIEYVEAVTGQQPDLETIRDGPSSLPLFLRERYDIHSARLFGKKCLLAIEKSDRETGSPAEYSAHAEAFKAKLGETVIIVVPMLPSYARNRMVRLGVPFIVPGSQMFIPSLFVDLREHFSQPRPTAGKQLTPTAQLILLFHLLRQPLHNLALQEIAARIKYSPMMVTKAKAELESSGICETVRRGRSTMLRFRESGKNLWNKVEPMFSSPVRKTYWLQWENPGYPALAAGLSALSQRSMIQDDRLPTFALHEVTFRANLEKGMYRECPGPEEATTRLEAWTYNPLLLGDKQIVDPLSLYLSLRGSADERIRQQLDRLIEEVPW